MKRNSVTYMISSLAGRFLCRAAVIVLFCLSSTPIHAVYGNINYDKATTLTIVKGLSAQLAAEKLNTEDLKDMLKQYSESSLALTGIWASKQLQVRAQRKGETFYYNRIRFRLEKQILPKIFVLGALFIEHPDQVFYWGPWLVKTVEDTAQLAMIFEHVVTNCTVSFADLPWLFINDDIRQILDIARLGDTDWKTLLSKIADFPSLGDSLNIDVMLPDMKSIIADATTDITTAASNIDKIIGEGGDLAGAIGGSSGVLGKALHTKITEWKSLRDSFNTFYSNIADGYHYIQEFKDRINQQTALATSVVDEIKSHYNTLAGDFTPEHLLRTANLFKINGYNINDYIMHYLDNLTGRYYRKKFWIERAALAEPNKVEYKVKPLDTDFSVCTTIVPFHDFEMLLDRVLADLAAQGWFPYAVRAEAGKTYDIYTAASADQNAKDYCNKKSGWESEYSHKTNANIEYHKVEKQYRIQFCVLMPDMRYVFINTTLVGYDATITFQEYGAPEVIYEEVYDSFDGGTNGEAAFRQQMLAKLDVYNQDSEYGAQYVLREGEPVYYDEADAERMKGIGEVSFKMRCEDGGTLYEKNYQFKVNEYHEPLTEESKSLCLAGTSAYNGIENRDKLSALVTQKSDSIRLLEKERDDLLIRELEIENAIHCQNGIISELERQLADVRRSINANNAMINSLKSQVSGLQNAISELDEDMQDTEDTGPSRIPHFEDELVSMYGVRWLGEGWWEGFTYKRRCNVSAAGANNECYFIVDVSKERGQSFFLGIRYHRAIIGLSMRLTYNAASEEVIETQTLDMRKSEAERSEEANNRRRQLQELHPDCAITMDFHKVDTIGDDPDVNNVHLLWAGDRLDIARLVERQLHRIYCDMVITERYLRSSRRIDQMLKADLRGAIQRGREARKHHYFIRRWKDLYGFARDTAGLQAYIINERKREKELWDSIMSHTADSLR